MQILQILQEPQIPCNPPKGDFAIETRVRGACPRRGRPRAPGRDPPKDPEPTEGNTGELGGGSPKAGGPRFKFGAPLKLEPGRISRGLPRTPRRRRRRRRSLCPPSPAAATHRPLTAAPRFRISSSKETSAMSPRSVPFRSAPQQRATSGSASRENAGRPEPEVAGLGDCGSPVTSLPPGMPRAPPLICIRRADLPFRVPVSAKRADSNPSHPRVSVRRRGGSGERGKLAFVPPPETHRKRNGNPGA